MFTRGEDLWSRVLAYSERDQKIFSFPLFSHSSEIKGSGPGPCFDGCCCGEDVATGFLCLLFDLALSGGLFHVARAEG